MHIAEAPVPERPGTVRRQIDHTGQVSHGQLVVVQLLMDPSAVVELSVHLRLQRHGLVGIPQGPAALPQQQVDGSTIAVGAPILRIQLDRAVDVSQPFLQLSGPSQPHAEVAVRPGVIGAMFERVAPQADGRAVIGVSLKRHPAETRRKDAHQSERAYETGRG